MKLQPLPKLQPITKLSPTMFATLKQCQLRAGLGQARAQQTTRSSTAALLGTIVHRVLENARTMNRDKDLQTQAEALWDKTVVEVEKKLQVSTLDRSLLPISRWKRYHLLRARTIRRCEEIASGHVISENQVVASERKFDNLKEGFTGKPDLIIRREDGLVIIDYKSTELSDDSDDRDEKVETWRQQVRFYAAIVKTEFGEYPVVGEIRLLNGDVIPIPINPEEVEQLVAEAQIIKERYNTTIAAGTPYSKLAQYSEENCGFCEYKGICSKFWEQNPQPIPGETEFGHLSGEIKKISSTNKGISRLVISSDKTDGLSQEWEITNLSKRQFENLRELTQGDSVRLINFKIASQDEYHAKPTQNSVIWKVP